MKRIIVWMLIGLLMASCQSNIKTDGLITIDLNLDYPEKELILQDFMEVQYVPLESSDEFITTNIKAIGERFIVMVNSSTLKLFDKQTGKGISVIDRKGQGAEEYTFPYDVEMDEANNELFVSDTNTQRMLVYDLQGNFKRSFNYGEDHHYDDITLFDKDYLVCLDDAIMYDVASMIMENKEIDTNRIYHYMLSKQDGSIVQEIPIPFEKIRVPMVIEGDVVAMDALRTVIPIEDDVLIVQNSSDTIYRFSAKDYQKEPFLVKIPKEEPERLLAIGAITPRYIFMETMDRIFDAQTGKGFPRNKLVYDREMNEFFKVEVLNDDYTRPEQVDLMRGIINGKETCIKALQAHKLIEAYEKGELKGKLKEIASTLNEDSNPVLMILTAK